MGAARARIQIQSENLNRSADSLSASQINQQLVIPRFHLGIGKWFHLRMAPCVIFEDAHLLVVHKPAGWNTHAPGPHAGEGIYDWLRQREPRWATLAILHRLDKETSGVLVFGKTPAANRSLTEQFTERRVRKKYLPSLPLLCSCWTAWPVSKMCITIFENSLESSSE